MKGDDGGGGGATGRGGIGGLAGCVRVTLVPGRGEGMTCCIGALL